MRNPIPRKKSPGISDFSEKKITNPRDLEFGNRKPKKKTHPKATSDSYADLHSENAVFKISESKWLKSKYFFAKITKFSL